MYVGYSLFGFKNFEHDDIQALNRISLKEVESSLVGTVCQVLTRKLYSVIKDVNKHLRPISLTPLLSKVAEEFVVAEHLRPSILKKIGDNQFGAIPCSILNNVCANQYGAFLDQTHRWNRIHRQGRLIRLP